MLTAAEPVREGAREGQRRVQEEGGEARGEEQGEDDVDDVLDGGEAPARWPRGRSRGFPPSPRGSRRRAPGGTDHPDAPDGPAAGERRLAGHEGGHGVGEHPAELVGRRLAQYLAAVPSMSPSLGFI